MAATVLGLTLLAAAAGCSSGGGGSDQKSDGGSTTAAAPTGITVPKKIDRLTMFGRDVIGMDESSDVIPKAVSKNLHLVDYYADIQDATSDHLQVRGGMGLPYPSGSDDAIKRLFSEWDLSTNKAKIAKVSSGSVGGLAECAPVPVNKSISCGWVSGKMALLMDFDGFSKGEATALVPKILEAMVTS
jgi:hypothetical protein